MKKLVYFFILSLYILDASPLQNAIDKARPGSILELSAGRYFGNITIDKELTIIGKEDGVYIDANKSGNVVSIYSSNVTLKNLNIINSGTQMHTLDSAILINRSKNIHISRCKIKESLYGINMYMVEDSNISDNFISSIKNEISLRGDALKIWHSNNNLIKNNTLDGVRDSTLTYSNSNTIEANTFTNSRFALHLSLSHQNTIKNNTYRYNSVALMLMGAKDTNITDNKILSSKGEAGIGLLLKEVSNLHFENNRVSFNGQGIYVDSKSEETGMQRYIQNNTITYNKEALHFHKDIQNNTLTNNIFLGNIDDVVKNTRNNTTFYNIVHHNYWDRYEGFDTNKDFIGDRSYKIYIYADQLWQYDHRVKFFYASPIMSILNFLTQVAPFIEPVLILEDTEPLIKR